MMITKEVIDGKWRLVMFETELLSDLYTERAKYARDHNLFGNFQSTYEAFDPDGKCVALIVYRELSDEE